ncbi:MAG: universal stress protein UspA related nucleotide-binding protein [Haloquadratum sp. J07HQX50]|jgi:Universal stress protein UspA and related nucleotide-binding proteins|nr:MAG: universal stress protein UspA related nucleotide-binding protein [Haloquadratum sp. J07HQX50]
MAIETVLVAVSEEDKNRLDSIASTVVDIAGPTGAAAKLAHIFAADDYETAREQLEFGSDNRVTPDDVANRYVTIRDLGKSLESADLEYSTHGRVMQDTNKGDEIVKLAEDIAADLLIVGGRKRSPTGKAIFGSTAQTVILNAPCPVTFVKSD